MAKLATLVDDTTSANTTIWAYGSGCSVISGVMHVPCTSAFPDNVTNAAWDLTSSSIYCKAAPAQNGVEPVTALVLDDGTSTGTSLRIQYDAGKLIFESTVSYNDAAAVSITYDAVAHAYWRIVAAGAAGSALTWQTSADGSTWVTQRTGTVPAYATAVTVHMSAFNTSGTSTDAQFSNFNTLSGGGNTGTLNLITPGNTTSATSGNDTATTISYTEPTHSAGDVLVLAITLRVNGTGTAAGVTYTAPTGWTVQNDTFDGGAPPVQQIIATKTGTGTPATTTWTFTSPVGGTGNGIAVICQAYSGVNAGAPVSGVGGQAEPSTTATATHSTPTVTPTQPNAWAIVVSSVRAGGTWTPPTGFTERADVQNTGSSASMELADSAGPVTVAAHNYAATGSGTTTTAIASVLYLTGKAANPTLQSLQDPWTGLVATQWAPQIPSAVTISGGVLSINPLNAGFPDLESLVHYDLTGSFLSAKFVPPTGGKGVGATMALDSASPANGTDLRWRYDVDSNSLYADYMGSAGTAYADPAEVAVPYDATKHVFLRISEQGGTVSWDYSADGALWTSAKTVATPAFATSVVPIFGAQAAVTNASSSAKWSNLNASGPVAKAATLVNTFDAAGLDTTLFTPTGSVTQNGALVMAADTTDDHVVTVNRYDLTGSNFAVDVTPATGAGLETIVGLFSLTPGIDLRLTFATGRLTASYNGEGTNAPGVDPAPKFIAWDTTTPAKARVRFLEDGTNINFDVSSDGGATYTHVRQILTTRAPWVSACRLYLGKDSPSTPGSAPTITSISPTSGLIGGGTTVTVTGTGFIAGTTVTEGGATVTPTIVSSTTLTFVSAAHAAGGVTVSVTNSNGTSNTAAFTYVTSGGGFTIDPTIAPPTTGTNCTVDFRTTVATPLRPYQVGATILGDDGNGNASIATNPAWKQALKDLGNSIGWRVPIGWDSTNNIPHIASTGNAKDARPYTRAIKDIGGYLIIVMGGSGANHTDNVFTTSDVTNVVTYYKNATDSPQPTIMIIGNEFTNGSNDPNGDYLSSLNARCQAAKNAYSSIKVSAPALPDMKNGSANATQSLTNAGAYMDFLSAHAYQGASAGLGATIDYYTVMTQYRGYAANRTGTKYPNIWPSLEEVNWQPSGTSAELFDWHNTCFIASVILNLLMAGSNCYVFADSNGYLSLICPGTTGGHTTPGTAPTATTIDNNKYAAYHGISMMTGKRTGSSGAHRGLPLATQGNMVKVAGGGLGGAAAFSGTAVNSLVDVGASDNGVIWVVNKDTADHTVNIGLGGVAAGTTKLITQTVKANPTSDPITITNIAYSGGILTLNAPQGTVTSIDL